MPLLASISYGSQASGDQLSRSDGFRRLLHASCPDLLKPPQVNEEAHAGVFRLQGVVRKGRELPQFLFLVAQGLEQVAVEGDFNGARVRVAHLMAPFN
jgi:hypothetical protein